MGHNLNAMADAIDSGNADHIESFFEKGVNARKSVLDS